MGTRLRYIGQTEWWVDDKKTGAEVGHFYTGIVVTIEETMVRFVHPANGYVHDGHSVYSVGANCRRTITEDNRDEWVVVCPECSEEFHACARCGVDYCDCTKEQSAEKDGVTFCSAFCAQ